MDTGGAPPGSDASQDAYNPHIQYHGSAPQSDGIVSDLRVSIMTGLQEYGWFVLLGAILAYFAYNRISNSVSSPTSSRSNANRSNASHLAKEDPDKILERQEKIAAARARMQAKLDEEVEKEKERERERNETLRQNKIQQWENLQSGKGYYSKMKNAAGSEPIDTSDVLNKMTSEKKSPLKKNDYSPLMGGGGSSSGPSCSWRPAGRRSGGG